MKNTSQPSETFCSICNYTCSNIYNYNRHLQSNKHKSNILIADQYCSLCNYKSDKRSNMMKHLKTQKHIQRAELSIQNNPTVSIQQTIHCNLTKPEYTCHCGKKYKYKSSLNRHIQSCNNYVISPSENVETSVHIESNNMKSMTKTNISEDKTPHQDMPQSSKNEVDIEKVLSGFQTILQCFGEKQTKILETIKEQMDKPNVIINNTQNNNFSIINYLNIHCKEAQNLLDYVKSMQVTNKDLEYIHNNTLMESINMCFIEPITNMEQKNRPLHCTDIKRHKFMVKHDGVWQRDTNHKIISDSFHTWANKVGHQLVSWTHDDLEWSNNEDKLEMSNDLIRKLHLLRFDKDTNDKVIQRMKIMKLIK
jgi:hypothetical protein